MRPGTSLGRCCSKACCQHLGVPLEERERLRVSDNSRARKPLFGHGSDCVFIPIEDLLPLPSPLDLVMPMAGASGEMLFDQPIAGASIRRRRADQQPTAPSAQPSHGVQTAGVDVTPLALHRLILAGNPSECLQLLASSPQTSDLNGLDAQRRSALHLAAACNYKELCVQLISHPHFHVKDERDCRGCRAIDLAPKDLQLVMCTTVTAMANMKKYGCLASHH